MSPRPLRVALTAVGSEGDVAPVIAIGSRLAERGHEVGVVVLDEFAHLVEAAGLRPQPISGGATRSSAATREAAGINVSQGTASTDRPARRPRTSARCWAALPTTSSRYSRFTLLNSPPAPGRASS